MEGIEIVVTPRVIERVVLGMIIVILAVLLIIKWNSGSCLDLTNKTVEKAGSNDSVAPLAASAVQTNITDQTNATNTLCANGIKDQDESDIDCGGTCPGCPENKFCNNDNDCVSELYCYQRIKCMQATCDDGVKNQDETNIDCGGTCSGYWWASDSKCHTTEEPSGRLEIQLSADTGESALSGDAQINSITIKLKNGLSKNMALTAYVYALTPSGKAAKPDIEGNNKVITTVILDSLPPTGELTKTVDLTNNTLTKLSGIDPDDSYQIQVDFKDGENTLIERKIWTNS